MKWEESDGNYQSIVEGFENIQRILIKAGRYVGPAIFFGICLALIFSPKFLDAFTRFLVEIFH